jgi:Leucine-rich repeat (LRR) protein
VFSSLLTNAQNVNIPGANFKAYLLADTDIYSDTEKLNISVQEAESYYGEIYVSNLNIVSHMGIEAFINVIGLYCDKNQITSLDISKNKYLRFLSCTNNKLINLNVSNGF